ncbi:hypothetical protein MC885_005925 [Smutsia gigantea]|nr:hypothetical protein MC885_005925 [Smutsia gigantea]
MESYHKPDQQKLQALKDAANRLRISSIQATTAAGSGHPTSCCSAAEIMAVLFFHTMRYKALDPRSPHSDRFVLSKGHAAPILYAVWAEAGFLPEAELLNLRKVTSDLDGHPVPKQLFTDVATGSLGQGLGAACGMAYTGKYFDKASWHTVIVDGHSVEELCKAFGQVKHQPTAIIAKTFKGRGISGIEDKDSWHGKPLPKNMADQIVQEIHSQIQSKRKILAAPPQEDAPEVGITDIRMPTPPSYKVGEKIATRKAYGQALAKLGHANDRVIALDGDTKNSTFSDLFRKEHPDRFIECYIAEQNMVSVAVGCATRDRTVAFCSTFAAFFTRAFDQIRMAAISESNVNLCGSHCGVSIGEDGPSQMALEDLAMFRSVPTATVFYPSDGVSMEKAVELAANTKGICFIRSSRPENAIIYDSNEDFQVGRGQVVLKSKDDQVTVVGAGVTLHEALAAADLLKKERINIRVLDPFTIKPLDRKLILESSRATKGRILTVEDHYYEGGLGEAVSSAVVGEPGVTVARLAVDQVPRSGKPAELLKMFGIDRDAIAQAVRGLVTKA